MSHDGWLICCAATVVLLGVIGLAAPVLRLRRAYVARQRVESARRGAFDGIRRLFDPQGQGLVRGAPDHFFAKLGEVELEVSQTTTRHDVDWRPWGGGPLSGAITNRGDLRIRAQWDNGTGPPFAMKSPMPDHEPRSFDEAYRIDGEHAALVRNWFVEGPLQGRAPAIYPWSVTSDGTTVGIDGLWASTAPAERLAAAMQVVAMLVEAARRQGDSHQWGARSPTASS